MLEPGELAKSPTKLREGLDEEPLPEAVPDDSTVKKAKEEDPPAVPFYMLFRCAVVWQLTTCFLHDLSPSAAPCAFYSHIHQCLCLLPCHSALLAVERTHVTCC